MGNHGKSAQVSGVSIFHFLPALLGIFVTLVGRHDVVALKEVVSGALGSIGVSLGSLATIGKP